MPTSFIAHASITINAPIAEVWDALINPAMIKQYLFGTEAISDWKVGSPIVYRGEWQGKSYEDKGAIVKIVPERLLETTYWSSMSGLTDSPEHYKKVTYTLEPQDVGTRLTITQDNNTTEEEKNHSEKNWSMVLATMKELLEKN